MITLRRGIACVSLYRRGETRGETRSRLGQMRATGANTFFPDTAKEEKRETHETETTVANTTAADSTPF